MKVRAKFRCNGLKNEHGHVTVNFGAVYDPDPNHVNYEWSKYTPAGHLSLVIAEDKPAAQAFEVDKEYYIDIQQAE